MDSIARDEVTHTMHLQQLTAPDLLEGFSSTIVHCLFTVLGPGTICFIIHQLIWDIQTPASDQRVVQIGTRKVTVTLLAADLVEVGFLYVLLILGFTKSRLSQELLEQEFL